MVEYVYVIEQNHIQIDIVTQNIISAAELNEYTIPGGLYSKEVCKLAKDNHNSNEGKINSFRIKFCYSANLRLRYDILAGI